MLNHHSQVKKILFDGTCTLCNFAVSNLQRNLKDKNYTFVPSESEEGILLIKKYNLGEIPENTIILFSNDKIYFKSDAFIELLNDMPVNYKIFKIVKYLPKKIRDWFYDIISKYRYLLFGKMKIIYEK
ncbi:MAG: DUF393 domain-containing protein [Ignavibacteriae bacterium]|nr:DUF393 domain-containing protein [Ignavibacteriota bacterium]